MLSPSAYAFDRQRIVVADEDSVAAARIIATLRRDGHCVTHEPTALSDPGWLALTRCHLVISSLRVNGLVRMDLLQKLRDQLPAVGVLCLSGETNPTLDPQLLDSLPVLPASFTTSELRLEVGRLLPQLRAGTVLARPSGETANAVYGLNPMAPQAPGLRSG